MATSLADFNPAPVYKPTLSDMMGTTLGPSAPVINNETTSNIAAHGALLSNPADVLRTYSNINTELSTGSSVTLDQLLEKHNEYDVQAAYAELQNILADPSISIEDKTKYMDGYVGMTVDHPGQRSLSVLVAQQAAMSPGSPDENDETVTTLLSDLSVLDERDAYNGWVQKKVNTAANLENRAWYDNVVDVLESLVPFADQAGFAKTKQALGELEDAGDVTKALTLLGESKDELRRMIGVMPMAERVAFAEKVIATVKASSGSITGRPNVIAQINQLNSILTSGSYGEGEKLADNIFSILDATIVLGPVTKLLKGPVKAIRAKAALTRAERAEARLAQVTPVVEESVDEVLAPIVNTDLDNTIDRIRGFDKATSDEIAQARNTIGHGLEEKLDVEEIISNTIAFDKFTADEIAEVRKVLSSPLAQSTSPVSDDAVQSVRDIVADNIVGKLGQLDEAPYSTFEKVREAINSNIDAVSILTPKVLSKKIIKDVNKILGDHDLEKINADAVKGLRRQIEQESNVDRLRARTTVDQTTVSQTVKDVNPAKARNAHNLIVEDTSGKAARALYGSSRDEAIANDFLPEVKNIDGSVRNKVNFSDESAPAPDRSVVQSIKENRGRTETPDTEKIPMREAVKKDFLRDVVGMVPRPSMATVGDNSVSFKTSVVDTPTGVKFDMVYGPKDGGFASKQQALEQALFSLRKYGVTENEVEVLGKNSDGVFVPVKNGEEAGGYLVRVKHDYEFTPADTVERTLLEPNKFWRFFDSRESWTDGSMGGLLHHFIPMSALVHRVIFNSASVAADRSAWYGKQLINLASSFAKKYATLTKRQKALVDAYRVEANAKGLKFNKANLEARGLNPTAIDALRDWKKTTDTMWWLENVDANKTARARGWMRFVDQANDTDLMVKPIPNRGNANGAMVYDSTKGEIVTLTKSEIDDIYKEGGAIGETRNTVEIGEESFDYILIRNKSDSSYVRRIRDEDNTLPYRDGYYPIKYTDTYFIRKTFMKSDGTTYTKAIATAGSHADAMRLRTRLLEADNKADIHISHDFKLGSREFEEAEWQATISSGRSAQRVRGKRLEDASSVSDLDHVHIESPEESLVQSIRSVSGRTAFRDWMETTKDRWISQYGDLLEKQEGYKMLWPTDIRSIGANKLEASSLRVKDAKATWRYVRAMEAGYVNLLDDASKNFFKGFSDTAGRLGWGWVEKLGLEAAKTSPTAFARKKAFRLLLAANPLRQAPVQAMQSLPILLATNPLAIPKIAAQQILINYVNTGGDARSFTKALARFATGLTEDEAVELVKNYERSGFEAAVDAHTLIRDQLSTIVDRTWLDKARTIGAQPINKLQKIGFNAGENFLMRTVWLSEYDILRKSGRKIDAAALDNLNARVRNLTLNMNKAGELPYNENMFSAALQFFQAPHKAFSQIILGHNGLTGVDRLKLGASYITTYGLGGGYLTNMIMQGFKGDPATKELIEGGLFNLTLNASLSSLFGKEVRTDFSDSLRLLQDPVQGAFLVWNGLIEGNIIDVLTSGAGPGLVVGDNPRITNFVKQMMRPFVVDNNQRAEELMQTGKSFLEIFSGGSNFFKAKYILEHQKSINSKGATVDYHVNDVEAILKAAGFATIDEVHRYASNEAIYKAGKAFQDDIKLVVDEMSSRLARQGISNDEGDWYLKMMSEAQRVFENDPIYMEEFAKQIRYKATTGENSLFTYLLSISGYSTPEEFEKLVKGSHLNESYQKILLDSKKMFEDVKNGS